MPEEFAPFECGDFTAWAPLHLTGTIHDPVGIFVPIYGESPDDDHDADLSDIARELRPLVGADVVAKNMDPSVGAGSFGVAAFWQIVSQGADLLAWLVVAIQAAPRIRNAARRVGARFGHGADSTGVSFSPAAIRVLVVADIAGRFGLEESQISDVQMLSHNYHPAEPREELRHINAAYTVSLSAMVDHRYRTWVYVVTSTAVVVSETEVDIPVPNASQWSDSGITGRSLLSEEASRRRDV
ncbi:MAG: hypothetical protein Q8K82_13610 [Gemmatimonadaceae bacterium]|nr:hypothetical protein [Gemmatimonadaceae bacterium]